MTTNQKLLRRRFLQASSSLVALGVAQSAAPDKSSRGVEATPKKETLTLNVRDFEAKGDGTTKDTAAIQHAIDRCSVLGGGNVLMPAGNYLTGALALRSNVFLRLEENAAVIGTPDLADYPISEVRWEGKWIQGRVGLIYALDSNHIGVVGPGKIIGNRAVGGRPTRRDPLRHPALVETIGCRDVVLDGFSATQGLMWTIHLTNSENITIKNLNIRTTTGNGDGIDIDSCKHVRVDNCDIATGDDCIAIKSGRGSEAYKLMHTTEDVVITNCTMADSIFACIGIGSETSGGVRNVRIEHCKFVGARTFALYVKTRIGRGAFIEDISANDMDVSGMVGGFLSINGVGSGLQDQAPVPGEEGIPQLRNFRFSNVRVTDCPTLVDGVRIHPAKPLEGFSLTNVTGTCRKGISLANTRKAEIRNIKVTGVTGPLIAIHNVSGKGLNGASTIEAPKVPEIVPVPDRPYQLH